MWCGKLSNWLKWTSDGFVVAYFNKKSRIYGTSDWLRQITWQKVGGRVRGRPNLGGRGGRPKWEAKSGRPKVGGWKWETSDWLGLSDRSIWAHFRPPTSASHFRPPTSAFHLKPTNFITFDSYSTSDRSLSDVLKIVKPVALLTPKTNLNCLSVDMFKLVELVFLKYLQHYFCKLCTVNDVI